MEAYETRFESFQKGKRVKKGSSKTLVKWPHPGSYLANPHSLAEAGFYYTPSASDRDAVTCFMCKEKLSGWEEEQDPFVEHVRIASSCCWAITRCGLINDMDEDGNFVFPDITRLPSSKAIEKARADTFGRNWPHDATKGHSVSSKKMAKAGFVFTPEGAEDDTATCFYCHLALGGWEEGDDPLEEHRKREAKTGKPCPFLTATQPKPVGRPPSRTQAKALSKSTTASKKKTPVVQQDDENSSATSEDDFAPATTSRFRASTASGTRTSSAAAHMMATNLRKSSRSSASTKSALKTTNGSEDEDATSQAETGKRVSKTKRKGGKSKARERPEAIQEEEDDDLGGFDSVTEPASEPAPAPKKRGRPPKKSTVAKAARSAPASQEPPNIEDEDAPEPVKKQASSRTRSKTMVTGDEPDVLAASTSNGKSSATKSKSKGTPALDTSMPPPPIPSQSTNSSKSAGKKTLSFESTEEVGESKSEAKAKAKHTLVSKMKGKTKKRVEESDDELAASFGDDEPNIAPTTKPGRKLAAGPVAPRSGQAARQPEAITSDVKHRKSSSTSEDAGYATAELIDAGAMEVDPQANTEPLTEDVRKRTSSSSKRHAAREPSAVQSDHLSPDLPRESSVEHGRLPSRAGSVRPFARSTSRPFVSLAARPPSRTGKAVVDISDSEDESHTQAARKPAKSNGVLKEPYDEPMVVDEPEPPKPAQLAQPLAKKVASKARASRAPSKTPKLQVEIVLPPPRSAPRQSPPIVQHADVEMEDDVDPVQRKHVPSVDEPTDKQAISATSLTQTSTVTPPPRTPSPLPTDTEAPKLSGHAPTLPSFDEEIAAEVAQQPTPPTDGDDTLMPFTPFLSMLPLERLTALTEEECDMTLEQYLRREIERECERIKGDGERRIMLFREKAAEARRAIESA
ncbi:BIR-domain-containing protein [Phanerochaete sordida]|uniref:BIR-domain-containing protein n=1 Tax=Phanerochaete sordida TaxID=48140 RepID=A0A9P3G1T2_9APHY|nr:BIR-domain-containing protein [Phanerochaete sordida]